MTHTMTFCFYASYLNSNHNNTENFLRKLKNFINCVQVKFSKDWATKKQKNLTKVNFISLSLVKNKIIPSCSTCCKFFDADYPGQLLPSLHRLRSPPINIE